MKQLFDPQGKRLRRTRGTNRNLELAHREREGGLRVWTHKRERDQHRKAATLTPDARRRRL